MGREKSPAPRASLGWDWTNDWPQSGSDLLLHNHFVTVVFEKFAFWGEKKRRKNKITNKSMFPKANVV